MQPAAKTVCAVRRTVLTLFGVFTRSLFVAALVNARALDDARQTNGLTHEQRQEHEDEEPHLLSRLAHPFETGEETLATVQGPVNTRHQDRVMALSFQRGSCLTREGGPSTRMSPLRTARLHSCWPTCHLVKASELATTTTSTSNPGCA